MVSLIRDAGLQTQVAILLTNPSDTVMLFHTEVRSPSHDEMNALDLSSALLQRVSVHFDESDSTDVSQSGIRWCAG